MNLKSLFNKEKVITQQSDEFSSLEKREKNKIEQEHYKNAKAFEHERLALAKGRTRTWQIVSGFFIFFSFALVIAIIGLTPLKQTVPYLIRVDNNSGYVDVLRPNEYSANSAKSDEDVMTQFMLKNYVRYHENYNWTTVKSNDAMVKSQSSSAVYNKYSNFQTSKSGYMAVLGENAQIETKDIYFTPLPANEQKNNVAQLRYTKRVLNARGEPDSNFPETQWLVIISYNFKQKVDADTNPLGLNVLDFSTPQQLK
ncbi:virB8 family protein [Enterobacter hormaechei]|uniref:virB8 family protein n=1 Tax=Enterobacter hormaechei TaxID=158836 RepID=UPI0020B8333A|nr:VirB8/TrbF family protein [Enterobacter hormaechei]UTI09415.1 VirB8/TrbF family protein [Enterobacter hormaechei subsp. steigerwaltii]